MTKSKKNQGVVVKFAGARSPPWLTNPRTKVDMFPFGTRARHMSRKLSALVNDEDEDEDDVDDEDGLEQHPPTRRRVSISAFISVY